jgi:hypothetical protein
MKSAIWSMRINFQLPRAPLPTRLDASSPIKPGPTSKQSATRTTPARDNRRPVQQQQRQQEEGEQQQRTSSSTGICLRLFGLLCMCSGVLLVVHAADNLQMALGLHYTQLNPTDASFAALAAKPTGSSRTTLDLHLRSAAMHGMEEPAQVKTTEPAQGVNDFKRSEDDSDVFHPSWDFDVRIIWEDENLFVLFLAGIFFFLVAVLGPYIDEALKKKKWLDMCNGYYKMKAHERNFEAKLRGNMHYGAVDSDASHLMLKIHREYYELKAREECFEITVIFHVKGAKAPWNDLQWTQRLFKTYNAIQNLQ